MADVDFDFFDDPSPVKDDKNSSESSPRNDEHGRQRKIETKVPTGKKGYSSGDSDSDKQRSDRKKADSKERRKRSSESDDSGSGSDKSDGSANKTSDTKDAWGEKNSVRPKSGHPNGTSRRRNRPVAPQKHNSHSRSSSRSRSRSKSGSDSEDSSALSSSTEESDDITQVSPLPSPQSTARSSSSRKSAKKTPLKYGSTRRSDGSGRPDSASLGRQLLMQPDDDALDLRLLMRAVLEMEKQREAASPSPRQPRFHVPPPPGSVVSGDGSRRKNQSFRNERTREIDRENTRLMQQIVRYAAETKRKKAQAQQQKRRGPQPVVGRALTTSAVNRRREQQRIDRENLAMLKRLEGAKATTTLRKDKLLNEFNNQRMAGVPMGAVHPLARGRRSSAGLRSPSPYGDQPRSRSGMSDVSSVRSGSTAGGRPQSAKSVQRPQSGKRSRPQSAKMVPSSRPDWESGW